MSWTKEELEKILKDDFTECKDAFKDGHKNDDAVDMSIICHCLGLDVKKLVDKMSYDFDWTVARYEEAMEHIERVQPYLDRWGESGTMDAMVYCINY